jgi:hypothetical protein
MRAAVSRRLRGWVRIGVVTAHGLLSLVGDFFDFLHDELEQRSLEGCEIT